MFKHLALFSFALAAIVKADYNPANMPDKTDPSHDQFGWNNVSWESAGLALTHEDGGSGGGAQSTRWLTP